MNERREGARSEAVGTLARLRDEADEARTDLAHVQKEVAEAESQLAVLRADQFMEANEHVVVSTLHAQRAVKECQDQLDEASRLIGLDPLTELPSRTLFLDRLGSALANARRHRTRLAVLFLDLNEFKTINDTLGHPAGDQALKQVAQCLASSVRETDTVSRHGGDEFLILLAEVAHTNDALGVAEKMIAALNAASPSGENDLRLSASIGVSVFPDHAENAEGLIACADAAMYIAKRHKLGSFLSGAKAPEVS